MVQTAGIVEDVERLRRKKLKVKMRERGLPTGKLRKSDMVPILQHWNAQIEAAGEDERLDELYNEKLLHHAIVEAVQGYTHGVHTNSPRYIARMQAYQEAVLYNDTASHNFFSLPAALRNLIYEHLMPRNLIIHDDYIGRLSIAHQRWDLDEPHIEPAICRVSRRLREETLPMYYHHQRFHVNRFQCSSVEMIAIVLANLGPNRLNYINCLNITTVVENIRMEFRFVEKTYSATASWWMGWIAPAGARERAKRVFEKVLGLVKEKLGDHHSTIKPSETGPALLFKEP